MNMHTLLRRISRLARAALDRDPLVTCTLTGTYPDTETPLTLHYLGRQRFVKDFFVFFARDADKGPEVVTQPETLWSFMRKRSSLKACPKDADAVFVDDWLQVDDAQHTTYAPHFNALLDVQPTWEAQCQAMPSKAHRRKIQAANKRGLVWRKSQSDADFDLFYDVMYAPFVADRFGQDATTVTREHMYKIFKTRGFLLMVEESGVAVSAAFMYGSPHQPGTLYYWKYGIAHAQTLEPHVFGERNAATEAVVLTYAIANKVRLLDFGLTRALPKNGIFTHKKRVGCTFHRHAGTPNFVLMFAPSAPRTFLQHFPIVVEVQGQMQFWLGFTDNASRKAAELLEDALHAGIVAPVTALRVWMQAPSQALQDVIKRVETAENVVVHIAGNTPTPGGAEA